NALGVRRRTARIGVIPRHVRFGSKADICLAPAHVRFTPNCDRESGLLQTVMSALPPKADVCGATRDVRYGPKADSCSAARLAQKKDRLAGVSPKSNQVP